MVTFNRRVTQNASPRDRRQVEEILKGPWTLVVSIASLAARMISTWRNRRADSMARILQDVPISGCAKLNLVSQLRR
jgi:hypothetical protein